MFQTMRRSRAAVAMPVAAAFGWPGGWRGHPQLILLREQGSDFTQEGLDVVEAFGDLFVGHEAVVRVLVEGTGRVGEVANLGVAGLAAKSADRLQVMAMPAVLSAPLVAAGLEHLDAAPSPSPKPAVGRRRRASLWTPGPRGGLWSAGSPSRAGPSGSCESVLLWIADKYAATDEAVDVLQGGVVGTPGYASPSGSSEVSLEVVQQEAQNPYLTLVDGNVGDALPEPGPGQGGCHGCIGAVDGLFPATQESGDPGSDAGPIPLGLLEDAVVALRSLWIWADML